MASTTTTGKLDGAAFVPRDATLRLATQLAMRVPGNIIEFGVADGASTRVIRNEVLRQQAGRIRGGPSKRIFACDSFEGLPEKYENADVGTFAGAVPHILGVEIVKGYFEDSLTDELAARVGRVALASLDADLYSSTRTALSWLTPLLHTGSLLLFDEYLGENESERRAHLDWAEETGVETVTVAELRREPSGWGEKPDRRVLVQVVDRGPAEDSGLVTVPGVAKRFAYMGRRGAYLLRSRAQARKAGLPEAGPADR